MKGSDGRLGEMREPQTLTDKLGQRSVAKVISCVRAGFVSESVAKVPIGESRLDSD